MTVKKINAYFYNLLGLWSTNIYTYIFHRHISDGSFHIGKEYKTPILPGLFDDISKNSSILDNRIDEILDAASMHVPNSFFHLRLRPYDCQSSDCLPPILVTKLQCTIYENLVFEK